MKNSSVGIIILGSQIEEHGLLPEDTDTKLAVHIAFLVAVETGSKLVGILNSASEHSYIKHGVHNHYSTVLFDLKWIIQNAMERLGLKRFVIVNGHGGNKLIASHLPELEKMLNARIIFNNHLVELEGAHASTGECSIAVAAGLTTKEELEDQGDFEKYPEVAFVGLKEAHQNFEIKKLAKKALKEGIQINAELGRRLIESAVQDIVKDIKKLSG